MSKPDGFDRSWVTPMPKYEFQKPDYGTGSAGPEPERVLSKKEGKRLGRQLRAALEKTAGPRKK